MCVNQFLNPPIQISIFRRRLHHHPYPFNAPNAPNRKQQSTKNQSNPPAPLYPPENSTPESTIRFSNRAVWMIVVNNLPLLEFLPHRRENERNELNCCNISYVTIYTVKIGALQKFICTPIIWGARQRWAKASGPAARHND